MIDIFHWIPGIIRPYHFGHSNIRAVLKGLLKRDIRFIMTLTVVHRAPRNLPHAFIEIHMIFERCIFIFQQCEHRCKLECRSWLRSADGIIEIFPICTVFTPAQVGHCLDLTCLHLHHDRCTVAALVFFHHPQQSILGDVLYVHVYGGYNILALFGLNFISFYRSIHTTCYVTYQLFTAFPFQYRVVCIF